MKIKITLSEQFGNLPQGNHELENDRAKNFIRIVEKISKRPVQLPYEIYHPYFGVITIRKA